MASEMWKSLDNTFTDVLEMTWPMILISVVLLSSIRLSYLLKSKKPFVLHKELLTLFFIIYILCLFQVVTFQDINSFGSNNFIPFREITRYTFGSRLFIKNIIGNMLMFIPYGFFVAYYSKIDDWKHSFCLVLIASLVIESTQLAIGRVFDVDDILLNVIGGILGFLIYKVFKKFSDKLPGFFQKDIFWDIISVLVFGGFIWFLVP